MENTILSLKENRAALIAKARVVLDKVDAEQRSINTEEQAEVDNLFGEADKLGNKISTEERKAHLSSLESDLKKTEQRKTSPVYSPRVEDRAQQHSQAVRAWLKRSHSPLTASDYEAAQAVGINLGSDSLTVQLRSLPSGTQGLSPTTVGGHLAPANFPVELVRMFDYFMPIRSVANYIVTDNGRDLPFIQADDTANSAVLTAEAADFPFADATFDKVTLSAYKYTSGVKVTTELLEDSIFNIESYLATELAARVARVLDPLFATGTGSGQPEGLVTAATLGKDTNSGTLTGDDLYDLIYSVPKQYRTGCAWVMNDTTTKVIRKIKNEVTGQYVYEPSLRADGFQFDTLLGYPVLVNNHLDEIGSNKKVAVFGQLKQHYVVRQVNDVKITYLDQPYRANGLVAWLIETRIDAKWKGPSSAIVYLQT